LRYKIPISREGITEAARAVYGNSRMQKHAQEQEKVKFYTYDDIPAPGDGEIDPETGFVSRKRIPKRNMPAWQRALVVGVIAAMVAASLVIGFSRFSVNRLVYEQNEETGAWGLQHFVGPPSQKELRLDFVRTEEGGVQTDKPITFLSDFAVADATFVESVYIGPQVREIDRMAFNNMHMLREFVLAPGNAWFCAEDGVLFSKDKTILISYPMGKNETRYVIPGGVTEIAMGAFYHNANNKEQNPLEEIVFNEGLELIGEMAFFGNINLRALDLPGSLRVIGKDAFSKCGALPYRIYIPAGVEEIGRCAFYKCANEQNTSIHEVYIGREAADIVLGDSWLPKIDPKAFASNYPGVFFGVAPEDFVAAAARLMGEGAGNHG